jgi:Flp pilus assembly protein TadG
MAIETAIVTPVLLLMIVGAFQVSMAVARQSELQSAASEATAIALAIHPTTQAQANTIKGIIQASTGLAANQVTVLWKYRCGTATTYVATSGTCSAGVEQSTFLQIQMVATYTPFWANMGVSRPVNYSVTRTVQVG